MGKYILNVFNDLYSTIHEITSIIQFQIRVQAKKVNREPVTKAITDYLTKFFLSYNNVITVEKEVRTIIPKEYRRQYSNVKTNTKGYCGNKLTSLGKLIYSKNILKHDVLWVRFNAKPGSKNSIAPLKNLIDNNNIPVIYISENYNHNFPLSIDKI